MRFYSESNKREVEKHLKVKEGTILLVYHTEHFHKKPKNALRPALKTMFEDAISSDLTLIFQNEGNRQVPVHKCILAAQSSVFKTLLSEDPGISTLVVTDCGAAAMKRVLEWIYTGELIWPEGNVNEVIETCRVSGIYKVEDLFQKCKEDIVNHINTKNVVSILV